jgi:hypothetical protein
MIGRTFRFEFSARLTPRFHDVNVVIGCPFSRRSRMDTDQKEVVKSGAIAASGPNKEAERGETDS